MGNPFINAGDFLIRTLFDLYISAVILRFLLQAVRADFYNPISQFLVTITNPLLIKFRRFIPGYAGVDVAALALAFVLELVKYTLMYLVLHQVTPQWLGLSLLCGVEIVNAIFNIYFYAIILQALLSWFNPGNYNPAVALLYRLTEPVLRPAQRLIPPISGLDISPMIVLIAMQLINMMFLGPMMQYSALLSIGVVRGFWS